MTNDGFGLLDHDDVAVRKSEIVQARARILQQIDALKVRVVNIDGALELIALFEKDMAAKAAAQRAQAAEEAEADEAESVEAEQAQQVIAIGDYAISTPAEAA